MNTRNTTLMIVGCLGAGFGAGWWIGRQLPAPAEVAILARGGSSSSPGRPATVSVAQKSGPSQSGTVRTFEGPPARDRQTAAAQFRCALSSLDRLERMKNLLVLLDKMTPENGQAYLDGWLDFVNDQPVPVAEAQLFNRRIGEVLGSVVVGRRTGTAWDEKNALSAVREQFIGWMYADSAAAKGWLDGLKNESFREKLLDAYVVVTAQKDMPGALAFLQSLPEEMQPQSASVIITAAKAARNQEQLGAWFQDLVKGAGEQKDASWLRATGDALMQNLAGARTAGASAAAIYEAHCGQPYMSAQWGARLAGVYARSDAAEGLAWAAKMSAAGQEEMLPAAIVGILPDKLDHALQWAQATPGGPQRDSLLAGLAERYAATDEVKAEQIRAMISVPR